MFAVNDIVNYSVTGICRVENIAQQEIAGENREFYVLKPVFDNNSTVMVPVDNEQLVSRMYSVLSKEDINALIKEMPLIEEIWLEDDRLRYEKYKGILSSGNRREVVGVIKALYRHREGQAVKGRKLRTTDERVMRDAERLLYSEIAYILGMKQEEVLQFIKKTLP